MSARLLLPLLLLAAPAAAQEAQLYADLNGDGRAERFWLYAGGDAMADLVIEGTGGATVQVPGFVWAGTMAGNEPSLELAENGSVRVISGNLSVGRNRWQQVLTIAYRNGGYMIAGYTYDSYDTLDLDAGGTCDVNLLTGRGALTMGGKSVPITVGMRAPFVDDWNVDVGVLPECAALAE